MQRGKSRGQLRLDESKVFRACESIAIKLTIKYLKNNPYRHNHLTTNSNYYIIYFVIRE